MKFLFSLKLIRRPKISKKAWITLREFPKYFEEVVWIADLKAFKDDLNTFRTRISRLVRKSGFQFTFMYMKLVLHFTVSSLSGRPMLISDQKGPYISLDGRGLPSIIPLKIREYLCSDLKKDKQVGGILSLLSIFRVFPTHVKPKYESITGPFIGTSRSIDLPKLTLAVKDFLLNKKVNRKIPKMKLIGGESAGPNGFKAL